MISVSPMRPSVCAAISAAISYTPKELLVFPMLFTSFLLSSESADSAASLIRWKLSPIHSSEGIEWMPPAAASPADRMRAYVSAIRSAHFAAFGTLLTSYFPMRCFSAILAAWRIYSLLVNSVSSRIIYNSTSLCYYLRELQHLFSKELFSECRCIRQTAK